jgi:ribonuclease P protein component
MPCYDSLRRQPDFDRVFDQGRWHRASAFALGVFERADNERSRVGFVAGRALGKPVRRTRARRRLREAFRSVADALGPGADVVVVAREPALVVKFASLTEAMLSALVQAGLLAGRAGPRDCVE